MKTSSGRRAALLLALALTVTVALGGVFIAASGFAIDPGVPAAANGAASDLSSLPPGTPSFGASQSPPSSQAVIDPPLPGLVASIGDSISVAFDSATLGPSPDHEWTMGTAQGDGVFSLLERFRALGADPIVADEAVAGARMIDAATQARLVLEQARTLPAGQTAFVTIELGGNNACAATPAATFEAQLRSAIGVLLNGVPAAGATGGASLPGLPAGSRLLILSVPNIVHLHDLTANVPAAQDLYKSFGICSRYLGPGVTAAQLQAGLARLAAYNAILARVCADAQATDGRSGRLYCQTDQSGPATHSMFGTDFTLADVSSIDYFHPSLEGQAKIAEGAWQAGYWSAYTPSSGGS